MQWAYEHIACRNTLQIAHLPLPSVQLRANPMHAIARVFLHCVLLPSLLRVGIAPLGSETRCCAPVVRCGTAQDQTREQRIQPKEKMLQTHQSPNINPLHCGGGPIKQQLERGPHYSTNNVQTSVVYNNPNQYCAPRTPAICCAGQPKGTHITTVLPPIKERLSSDAQIRVKESP